MTRLWLAFVVGFCYAVALWFNEPALHTSVALLSVPLWFLIALRCAAAYGALLFLARYLPGWRLWLVDRVQRIVESEDW